MTRMLKLLVFCWLVSSWAHAEIESWTGKNGQVARMELLSVTRSGEVVTGHFRTEDGVKISMQSSRFSESDEKKIMEWNEIARFDGPQFKHARIPVSGPGTGYSGSESLEYGFFIPDPRIVGIRKDEVVIHSCSLSAIDALPGDQVFNFEEEAAPKIDGESWSLSACREYGMAGFEAQRRGLNLNFTLNNGGAFSMEQARNSELKAEVIVAASNNLRSATLRFSPSDCLVGDRVIPRNGKAPTNERLFRNVGPIKVWLEEVFEKTSADGTGSGAKHLVVRIDEPYLPSSVKSTRILSNDIPITRLSEVTTSEIVVKMDCWTDFTEMKLLCEKKASDPGM